LQRQFFAWQRFGALSLVFMLVRMQFFRTERPCNWAKSMGNRRQISNDFLNVWTGLRLCFSSEVMQWHQQLLDWCWTEVQKFVDAAANKTLTAARRSEKKCNPSHELSLCNQMLTDDTAQIKMRSVTNPSLHTWNYVWTVEAL
jgi:hypothetical protein